jgi:WD40 repeat protein
MLDNMEEAQRIAPCFQGSESFGYNELLAVHQITAIAPSRNGKVLASASRDNTVRLWDATTGVWEQTLDDHGHCIDAVAFSPDDKVLASASVNGTVRLWDSTTGA